MAGILVSMTIQEEVPGGSAGGDPLPAGEAGHDPAASPAAGEATPEAAAPRLLCPYLVGREGDWRAIFPSREHRCAAVDPAAPLSTEKQRRLCLVAAHRECSTFLAARRALVPALEEDREHGGRPEARSGRRWSHPRTAPVLIERGRPSLLGNPRMRPLGQIALVALMAVAFILLLVARSG
jgi:hypothetical protein